MSSPPDPTSPPKSFKTKLVTLTQYPSFPSIQVESEMKTSEVFMVSFDCSTQGEIMSISTKSSPSTEVISFDWSNLTESNIHLCSFPDICVSCH